MACLFSPLPKQQYDIIYADPPWHYTGKQHSGGRRADSYGAATYYPTLKLSELKELPVQSICQKNCLLFLWTTGTHIGEAIELGQHWGFVYTTIAFVWDKQRPNAGYHTLPQCEYVLLLKRGRRPDNQSTTPRQLVSEKRGRHSAKPDSVRCMIEQMYPYANRIELFSRQIVPGWDAWGNDVNIVSTKNKTLSETLAFTRWTRR